jgi:exosortase/archaeosortase
VPLSIILFTSFAAYRVFADANDLDQYTEYANAAGDIVNFVFSVDDPLEESSITLLTSSHSIVLPTVVSTLECMYFHLSGPRYLYYVPGCRSLLERLDQPLTPQAPAPSFLIAGVR